MFLSMIGCFANLSWKCISLAKNVANGVLKDHKLPSTRNVQTAKFFRRKKPSWRRREQPAFEDHGWPVHWYSNGILPIEQFLFWRPKNSTGFPSLFFPVQTAAPVLAHATGRYETAVFVSTCHIWHVSIHGSALAFWWYLTNIFQTIPYGPYWVISIGKSEVFLMTHSLGGYVIGRPDPQGEGWKIGHLDHLDPWFMWWCFVVSMLSLFFGCCSLCFWVYELLLQDGLGLWRTQIISSSYWLSQRFSICTLRNCLSTVTGKPKMFQVTVALTSGHSASFSLLQSSKVGDLKTLAQEAFHKGFLRLVTARGRMLTDLTEPLGLAGQDGDQLAAIVLHVHIAATRHAFALWCSGGDGVLTWGNPRFGGDSSAVQHQLKNVQHVQATSEAFVAILEDGSCVAWGDLRGGGDSSAVQGQLRNVQQICGTGYAFAAILEDGSVVTWGSPQCGGDCSAVQHQLRNVHQIQATDCAFAAMLKDGTVVTWGDAARGGDSSAVQSQLKRVQQIEATSHAFAAILEDGSVVTWGYAGFGADSSGAQGRLSRVQQIRTTNRALAAVLQDGLVVTWGNPDYGGDSSRVQHQLKNVLHVQATWRAFAAVLEDGSVVTWGNPEYGGDSSSVQDRLKSVQKILATVGAFAAILADGCVVTWGSKYYGGDSSAVKDQLRSVQQIHATDSAFAAIRKDGSIVTWGHPYEGGDSSAVQQQLVCL